MRLARKARWRKSFVGNGGAIQGLNRSGSPVKVSIRAKLNAHRTAREKLSGARSSMQINKSCSKLRSSFPASSHVTIIVIDRRSLNFRHWQKRDAIFAKSFCEDTILNPRERTFRVAQKQKNFNAILENFHVYIKSCCWVLFFFQKLLFFLRFWFFVIS